MLEFVVENEEEDQPKMNMEDAKNVENVIENQMNIVVDAPVANHNQAVSNQGTLWDFSAPRKMVNLNFAIRIPNLVANDYNLDHYLVKSVTNNAFSGISHEDPIKYLIIF